MVASRADIRAGDTGIDAAALRARLVPPMPGSRLWGWLGPLLVTALGTFVRFNRLSVPHAVIFDETYYVPDALGILRFGVEHNYIAGRNVLIARGDGRIFAPGGEFVVHPPFGKILIAGGEWVFGLTPFGWRFAVAVAGSLAILILARTARRMTRSTLLGCVAGLLLALDGLEFVMSRTALLDIFVMFWVLAAFALLVIDRDRTRGRYAQAAIAAGAAGGPHAAPPRLGVRWLRLARRGVPGAGVRVEVERHLVRAGVFRADPGVGHRRPPRRRADRQPPAGRGAGAPPAGGPPPSPCCRWRPTWPPGPGGSPPAAAMTGSGPPSTASTPRSSRRWCRCWSTTRRCSPSTPGSPPTTPTNPNHGPGC